MADECGRCALEADHFGPCWWPGMPGEGHDDDCEAEFVSGPMLSTACGCDVRGAAGLPEEG